jgi:DNA-binding transcriptional ArsR family regulator
LSQPADITDPKIAKAYAHPLRIEIMGLLDNRVASPATLAKELGASLPLTSYHVRQLASLGLLKLVRRRQRRGSIEHFYTAAVRPRVHDETWAAIPSFVKRALVAGRIGQLGKELSAAAEAGGFDRDDMHLTRTRTTLTREGWDTIAKELAELLERIDRLKAEDAERLKNDPHAERIDATVVLMLFESPQPSGFDPRDADSPKLDETLQDLAPPA